MRRYALLALLVAAGCAAQPTQIVVVVDSDLEVPSTLARVRLDVTSTRSPTTRAEIGLGESGAPRLPLTLALFPRGGADTEVVVRAQALDPLGDVIVQRDVRTRFVQGSSRMLRVLLAAQCAGVRCPSRQTCDETGCRDVDVPPESLAGWPGTPPVLDGPACEPRDEECDGWDDDCDGDVDEDFDVTSDASHCGACGRACGTGACAGGYCSGERPAGVVAGGAHACVLRDDGEVLCWGWNLSGQLGRVEPDVLDAPVELTALGNGNGALALGASFTCALGSTGTVRCLGDGSRGQLGDATSIDRAAPMPVMSGATFTAIGAGARHACGVTNAGTVLCWGANDRGQLGDGTSDARGTPVEVTGVSDAAELALGLAHTCVRRNAGTVACWGANDRGQLGAGLDMASSSTAVDVMGLTDAVAIAAGRDFACAVRMGGTVVCWGDGTRRQLGRDGVPFERAPAEVPGITGATASIAGASSGSHACVVTSAGALVCWGANTSGQLGDATLESRIGPVTAMLEGVTAVAAGGIADDGTGFTCAVLGTGAVRCFGDGALGQLGSGLAASSAVPLPVVSLP